LICTSVGDEVEDDDYWLNVLFFKQWRPLWVYGSTDFIWSFQYLVFLEVHQGVLWSGARVEIRLVGWFVRIEVQIRLDGYFLRVKSRISKKGDPVVSVELSEKNRKSSQSFLGRATKMFFRLILSQSISWHL
jgi:hypothetical protein